MKILITGGTGLLGKALIENNSSKYEIIGTYIGNYSMEDNEQAKYLKADVRDKDAYIRLFTNFKPEVVVHTAGVGSPDFAEKNKDETWQLNILGTQNIISICELFNSKFVYISSNGIYDGENAPYCEEDEIKPINYYGKIKLKAEEITKKAHIPFAIVRPILMYGWNYSFERYNIVTHTLATLQNNEEIFAYDDVYSNPLFSYNCANTIWKIIEKEKYDIFNIAGNETVSIFQLLKQVADVFDLDEDLVKPVQQGFFNELVKRPRDTSFKTEKMEKELELKPLSLEKGLGLMKALRK
jgi:dTDP-4-dehydrorhamnose reductase